MNDGCTLVLKLLLDYDAYIPEMGPGAAWMPEMGPGAAWMPELREPQSAGGSV
jgi:hypothetical protein